MPDSISYSAPEIPSPVEPQKKEKQKPDIQPLHTLQTDTSRFIEEKGVTLSTIVAESGKRKREEAEASRPSARLFTIKKIIITFFILMIAGVGAIIFLSRAEKDEEIISRQKPSKPSLLYPAFDEREVAVSQLPSEFFNVWQPMLERNFPEGQMLALFVFHERENVFLSFKEFLEFLSITAPRSLVDSSLIPWTLGVMGTRERVEPVFIIPTSSFHDAFKGMLEWEKDLPFAFRNMLRKDHPKRIAFEQFEDALIANQSVRILTNEEGKILFAYTFFDKRILIMSTSPEVLETVIKRFLLVPPLRIE